jgi:hypothetical protein
MSMTFADHLTEHQRHAGYITTSSYGVEAARLRECVQAYRASGGIEISDGLGARTASGLRTQKHENKNKKPTPVIAWLDSGGATNCGCTSSFAATPSRGLGAVKSLQDLGPVTAWGATRRFFFRRRRFDYSNRNQRIQTPLPLRPQHKNLQPLSLKRVRISAFSRVPLHAFVFPVGRGPQISGPFQAGTGGLGTRFSPQISARTFF